MDPMTVPAIEIRTSSRRRKSAIAFWEAGHVVVVVPERWPLSHRERCAARLAERLERSTSSRHGSDAALATRAGELGDRYFGGVRPSSIRWSPRQLQRWGSCTLLTREIRIAERLRAVPEWVLDSVIVHELAHLLESDHGARFNDLVRRDPRYDEAQTYLSGYALGLATSGRPSGVTGEPAPQDATAGAGDEPACDGASPSRYGEDPRPGGGSSPLSTVAASRRAGGPRR